MAAATSGPERAAGAMRSLRRRVALRNYTLLMVVAVVWIVFQATTGIFLSPRNLTLLALQSSITALAAISAVMLIVTRNFDISVGSAVALVGVVAAVTTSPTALGLDPLWRPAGHSRRASPWGPGTACG